MLLCLQNRLGEFLRKTIPYFLICIRQNIFHIIPFFSHMERDLGGKEVFDEGMPVENW